MERQLRRQSIWLRDSLHWIMREKVLDEGVRPVALDVGCGPGFVMEVMGELVDVQGVDADEDMVRACRARGLQVEMGSAYDLPFEEGSFDIVYCTFLMLWLEDPHSALMEMARVSRRRVLCLAEPDFGARIDYPEDLDPLRNLIIDGIKQRGGDATIGRKLRELFSDSGLSIEVGIHPGVWSLERLGREFEDEWSFVESLCPDDRGVELEKLKPIWRRAISKGSLFQFNPIFYALGDRIKLGR
jgi:SAM-dependent methyltransferase